MGFITLLDYLESIYKNDLINKTGLNEIPYKFIKDHNFSTLISNDVDCFELIKELINQTGTPTNMLVKQNIYRASHIIITWILGVGLGKKLGVDKEFNFYDIWLMASIVHDYGYFKKEVRDPSTDLTLFKYKLLTNHYDDSFLKCLNNIETNENYKWFFYYSYNEIINYFNYSKEYHKNEEANSYNEKCDHGIIGGCALFDEYCIKCLKEIEKGLGQSDIITINQKIACITCASHNIFKSNSLETDEIYKKNNLNRLLSTSTEKINKEYYILFLLCLVDTIECTKRFSKKDNPKQYLQQLTTLKLVKICEVDKGIKLDFSDLASYLKDSKKDDKLLEKLSKHCSSIEGLSKWADFKTNFYEQNNKFKISVISDS